MLCVGVVVVVVGGVVVVVVVVVLVVLGGGGGGVYTLSSPRPARFGKSTTFWPFSATCMKSVQMRSGTVAPVSSPTPFTWFIDSSSPFLPVL